MQHVYFYVDNNAFNHGCCLSIAFFLIVKFYSCIINTNTVSSSYKIVTLTTHFLGFVEQIAPYDQLQMMERLVDVPQRTHTQVKIPADAMLKN